MKSDYAREVGLGTILESIKLNLKIVFLGLLPASVLITMMVINENKSQLAKYTTVGSLQVNNNSPLTYSDLPTLDPNDSSGGASGSQGLATNSETIMSLLTTEYILEKIVKDNHLDIDIKLVQDNSFSAKIKGMFKPKVVVGYPEITLLDVGHDFYNHQLTIQFISKSKYVILDKNRKVLTGTVGVTAVGEQISIKINSYDEPSDVKFIVVKSSLDSVLDNLEKQLKIEPVIIVKKSGQSDTGIINISITDINAKKQASLINDIMEEIRVKSWERQRQNLKQSIEFIENQTKMAKNSLNLAQESLVQLQSSRKIIDLDGQSKSDLLTSTDLDLRLMENSIAINQYSTLYTKNHPMMISLNQQRDALMKKRDSIIARLNQLPEDEANYVTLKRNLDVQQELYLLLLGKEQNLKIKFFGITSPVEILSYATENVAPIIVPLSVKVIASDLMLVFVLEVVLVLYFTIWNTGDPYLLPAWLESSMLAIFPHLRTKKKGVDYTHPSFNVLSVYFITLLNQSASKKVICNFGSIYSSAGKTFLIETVINYVAEQGKKVLHIKFSKENNSLDLSNLLTSQSYLNNSPSLKVSLQISIAKPLDIDSFNLFLERLENFEFVLIESTPIIEDSLFMSMAKIVENNLIISTPADTSSLITRVTDDFANLGVRIDRVIFNHPKKPFLNSVFSINKVK